MHRLRQSLHEPRGRFRVGGESAELPVEARAADQLHDDVGMLVLLTDREDRHDMRVAEPRGDPGLIHKPPPVIYGRPGTGLEHLEGDESVLAEVAGLVDDPRLAAAQFLDQIVVAEVAVVHRTLRSSIVLEPALRVKSRNLDFWLKMSRVAHRVTIQPAAAILITAGLSPE